MPDLLDEEQNSEQASTEYGQLALRPRSDKMDDGQPQQAGATEKAAKKRSRRQKRAEQPRVFLARRQAERAAGLETNKNATTTTTTTTTTMMPADLTPQRRSARLQRTKTQQERDEELISSQLETA
ncbi:hypothetical protein Slin14017_G112500 [Septoria linicola]|nr:hypothetical protein Slin14017_G112500 [Septoria linicola]